MITLTVNDLMRALQNAQNEGVETVAIYDGKKDCIHRIRHAQILPHNNVSDLVLFVDTTCDIQLDKVSFVRGVRK
jgi:hypothetical protein